MRHLVAVFNPRTGSHRIAGSVMLPGDDVARVSVEAKHVPNLAQHLNPQDGEAVIVFDVPETPTLAAPKPQGIRLIRKEEP